MIKSNYHAYTIERGGLIERLLGKSTPVKNAVLVHGLSSGSRTWDEAIVHLMSHGYNVLTLDLSGHGDSGRLEKYGFELWVNNVVDAIEKHGLKSVDLIMGHSMGGLISIGVANTVEVKNVVLIDPLIVQPNRIVVELIKRALVAKYTRNLKSKLKEHPDRSAHIILNEIHHAEKWDSATLNWFDKEEGLKILKDFGDKVEKPRTLIIKPVKSILLSNKDLEKFKPWGSTIIELKNVGHGVHLDDFEQFRKTVTLFLDGFDDEEDFR